jgi:hypothetical protein
MTTAMNRRRATKSVLRALNNRHPSRKPAHEYVRDALQTLSNVAQLGGLDRNNREDVSSAMRRLWLALREIEQNNN